MTEFQRYLAEEIAVDHADGLISRSEALRRLALLGLSVTAGSSLPAAFAGNAVAASRSTNAPASPAGATSGESHEAAPVPTKAITFRGPQGRRLMGAWAPARRARGGVLVIHENRGLNDHTRSVAGRFAASGYSALAIDLLSEEAEPARSVIQPRPPPR